MACPKTKAAEAECWCPDHGSDDPEENERRQLIGEATFEFWGGEALHVFIRSKVTGGLASLCNLRQAIAPEERLKFLQRYHAPTLRCDQCNRTLRSRTPNARLTRYFQEQRFRRAKST
jgi:hypothetical protein